MTGLIELPAAGQPSAGTARNRGISYHGNLGRVLRDLTGFATLMFELLQNADDAGATTVRIDVGRDALVVVNDAVFSDCGNQDLVPEDCLYLDEFGHRCDFHSFREVASGDKRDRADTTAGSNGPACLLRASTAATASAAATMTGPIGRPEVGGEQGQPALYQGARPRRYRAPHPRPGQSGAARLNPSPHQHALARWRLACDQRPSRPLPGFATARRVVSICERMYVA